jgi:hypothetical protein
MDPILSPFTRVHTLTPCVFFLGGGGDPSRYRPIQAVISHIVLPQRFHYLHSMYSSHSSMHATCPSCFLYFIAETRITESWTVTFREQHKLQVFENELFGCKNDALQCYTARNLAVYARSLACLLIVMVVKSRGLRRAGHVSDMP